MKKIVGLAVVLVFFGSSLVAQQKTGYIAGKWSLTMEGETSNGHHFPTVELEVEQKDGKIIANFMIPDHGDLPMEGVFVDGKLTLRTTEDGFIQMDLNGKLNEDGTLSGSVKGPMGNMTWTAKRAS